MFYSQILARFIVGVNFSQLSASLKQRAKELMLDSFGTALAARKEQSVQNAMNAFKTLNSSKGECELWGQDAKMSAEFAAMFNGISAHALDFDDTHTEAILHASAILTPLCLSWGFSVCKDGEKVLKAFILGWEIGARIGVASKGSFHKRGFHTTAICGHFASVVAAGVLLDLNEEEFINALGLAGSFASGVNEFLSNGSNSKVLHIANAIKNGILVANLAKNKLTGPQSIFEGRDNIFRTFGCEELCDKSELDKGLGEFWQLMQVSIKPYPCCHFAHGLIECALALRNDGLKAEQIEHIQCFVDEVPISFICDPIKAKYSPQSAYEAKFSAPFLMALAFTDGVVNLRSYENLKRDEVLEFGRKISYEKRQNKGFPKYFPGHIKATLTNKQSIFKDIDINKGNPDKPLSLAELKRKFFDNAKMALDEKSAQRYLDKIMNLESQSEF